jgi:hypothetical protein
MFYFKNRLELKWLIVSLWNLVWSYPEAVHGFVTCRALMRKPFDLLTLTESPLWRRPSIWHQWVDEPYLDAVRVPRWKGSSIWHQWVDEPYLDAVRVPRWKGSSIWHQWVDEPYLDAVRVPRWKGSSIWHQWVDEPYLDVANESLGEEHQASDIN